MKVGRSHWQTVKLSIMAGSSAETPVCLRCGPGDKNRPSSCRDATSNAKVTPSPEFKLDEKEKHLLKKNQIIINKFLLGQIFLSYGRQPQKWVRKFWGVLNRVTLWVRKGRELLCLEAKKSAFEVTIPARARIVRATPPTMFMVGDERTNYTSLFLNVFHDIMRGT